MTSRCSSSPDSGTQRMGDPPRPSAGLNYDPADDGKKSWTLSIAAQREISIRSGWLRPSPNRPDETRWASEGPVPNHKLETLRRPV